jgi:hypothetical protein
VDISDTVSEVQITVTNGRAVTAWATPISESPEPATGKDRAALEAGHRVAADTDRLQRLHDDLTWWLTRAMELNDAWPSGEQPPWVNASRLRAHVRDDIARLKLPGTRVKFYNL